MPLDVLYQQELFEAFQAGDASSLTELLDVERQFLFDYLLRMTGDVNLSRNTLEEVYKSLLAGEMIWESLSQIRFEVYNQARSMHPERWNADVSKLQHPSLMSVLKNPGAHKKDRDRAQAYSKLNRAIGSMEPLHREVLLLHIRSKFTLSEIAKIVGQTRENAEQEYGQAIRYLRSQVPNLPSDPRKVVTTLLNHPLPREEGAESTDLSGLIGGLRRKDQGVSGSTLFYWFLTILVLVILFSLIILLARPELLKKLLLLAETLIITLKSRF